MLKTTIKRAVFGFLLGVAVGNIIAYITSSSLHGGSLFVAPGLIEKMGSEANAFLLQSVLSGLIGLVGCGGMSFYEIDSWSMARIMLVHFTLIEITFLICGYELCWLRELKEILIMTAIMAAWYLVIWLVISAYYRAQIRELNDKQEILSEKILQEVLLNEKQ